MTDIERKTVGMLIDELITTSMKCWHAQERISAGGTDTEVAKAAQAAQQLNARRNQLIQAIDQRLNESGSPTDKTYG